MPKAPETTVQTAKKTAKKKTAPKKTAKKSVKNTPKKAAKNKAAKKKVPPVKTAKKKNGISEKQQKVIDHLGKVKAFTEQTAVPRDRIWKLIGEGDAAKHQCSLLRKAGLIAWSSLDDKGKAFYLTSAGKKCISK